MKKGETEETEEEEMRIGGKEMRGSTQETKKEYKGPKPTRNALTSGSAVGGT